MSEFFNTAVLQTPAPTFTASQAEDLIGELYDLTGNLTALVSERDQNFHLRSQQGSFVVKFSNEAEDPNVTDFQTAALLHMADIAPDLPVQRVVASKTGKHIEWIANPASGRHCLRVLTYLDGRPLGKLRLTPAHLQRELGLTLGKMGEALNHFSHSGSHAPLLWDLQHADHLLDVIETLPGEPLHQICHQVVTRFRDDIKPRLAELPSQVIYNDLNPSNVLITDGSAPRVCGVIDFGDITYSARVVDLAVAAAYQLTDGADPLAGAAEVVGGYCSVSTLLDEEFEVLFDLVILRLAITIAITHWRAELYPQNRNYILRNAHAAADRLTALHALSSREAMVRLKGSVDMIAGAEAGNVG